MKGDGAFVCQVEQCYLNVMQLQCSLTERICIPQCE